MGFHPAKIRLALRSHLTRQDVGTQEMHNSRFSLGASTATLVVMIGMSPVAAATFKPMKYLQDASVISALATAVSQLTGCEEDLTFSETTKKDDDGDIVTVVVTCRKFPDDNGKLSRANVRIELELNDDGSVGPPLAFGYD